MFTPEQYQLLDFGEGRRLEQFAGVMLDRPCPAVEGAPKAAADLWQAADARFDRTDSDEGQWSCRHTVPETWTVRHAELVFELKLTPFGHLGLFPEQSDNWDWIAEQVRRARESEGFAPGRPVRVLNLFAYTGGSTLAAAAAGAEVSHVDAARNSVAWARRNAELSGLAEAPIRWIADDAVKFVKRELRRGNQYDAVILDPPSYGHGAHGEVWRLSKHLPRLLELCFQITAPRTQFLLLTCHTPDFGASRLRRMVAESLRSSGADPGQLIAREMIVPAAGGRKLPSGTVVRWQRR